MGFRPPAAGAGAVVALAAVSVVASLGVFEGVTVAGACASADQAMELPKAMAIKQISFLSDMSAPCSDSAILEKHQISTANR
jgi:hypothetical protein